MKALKKSLSILLTTALVSATAVPAVASTTVSLTDGTDMVVPTAEEMVQEGDFAANEVIVVFDDSVKDKQIKKTIASADADCTGVAVVSEETKIAVAELESGTSVEDAITAFNEQKHVLYAQPNYRYQVMSDGTTNDPYNNDDGLNQWYLTNIKAREAWDVMEDIELSPVTVAVIDTGADRNHEDLKGVISEESVRISGGELEPLKGDSDEHGTHVCGIIGATSNNEKGITGVATGVSNDYLKILAIDATSQDYPGEYFDTYGLVTAIDYAIEKEAKVINMSLGGPGVDLVMEAAVEKAYEAGVTVVAAAGNEDTDDYSTPSDCNEVISVCNTTKEDRRYDYTDWLFGMSYSSNFGQPKDISAPGTTILSTVPNGYENFTGTSMSAPMVSAVAAMTYAVNPELTPAQLRNILCATARDVDEPGYDYYTGYGVVNAVDAVCAAHSASTAVPVDKVEFKEDADYVFRLGVAQRGMLEVLSTPAVALSDMVWTSSDETVATVDYKGKVQGISAGIATITCTTGGVSSSCNVEVQNLNAPKSVKITNWEKAAEMAVNDWFSLETEILPRYADEKKVFWKSSDLSVVTVDELGTITARGVGEAKVMGYVYNSLYTDFDSLPEGGDPLTAVISVKVNPSVSNVEFVYAPDKVRLTSTPVFTAKAVPEDAVNADISWYTSNRAVADIDAETGVLYPVSTGKVTVTAATENGKKVSKRILIYTTDQKKNYHFKAVSTGYNSVKLSWDKIAYADGYVVYRDGKAIKTLSKDTRSFTNKKLKCGEKYKYSVRAFYENDGEKDFCDASAVKTVKPVPAKPVVKAKAADGKITLTWSKVSGATKYEVYKYSSTKKKYVRVATTSKTSYTDKSVKKGKSYSYKVKAYRLVDGSKVYGNFSSVVKKAAK